MNPLDSYLDNVARELRSLPQSKRDEELRELRSHLELRTEDFENLGLPSAAAQAHAVNEFGSAHSVGSKLCDAWEGVTFTVGRLISTLIAVTIIWLITNIALSVGWMALIFWDKAALFPEIPYDLAIVFIGTPFYCGWLFSRRLGRRGPLVALLYFSTLSLLTFNTRTYFPEGLIFSFLPFPIFNLLLAFCGAVCGNGLRQRRLQMAFANGQSFTPTTSKIQYWRSLGLGLIFALIVCPGAALRIYSVLHPTTSAGVLRSSLTVNRGMNHGDFDVPTVLEIRELPPTTPAELAGNERRVFFRLQVRAAKSYAQRRIAFLSHELASPQQRKSWGAQPLRDSLQRLQRNSEQVQGTARLVKTSNGWQVDENSFDRSRLWAWCYDIYYTPNTPTN
ncbi:hypothetical protein EON83_27945 [bacterium]|nr:MAG: hypothetical protein EON83_27945 [bacterium]